MTRATVPGTLNAYFRQSRAKRFTRFAAIRGLPEPVGKWGSFGGHSRTGERRAVPIGEF
jgi:hypothetical protein